MSQLKRIIAVATIVIISLFNLQPPALADVGVSIVFSGDEIKIISAWYRDHESAPIRGNGKGKSKGLPPGIAKNLERGKSLPPGIAKQYLPDGLQQTLPTPPAGYERIIVEGKVLLVEIATRIIHDILTDVILD